MKTWGLSVLLLAVAVSAPPSISSRVKKLPAPTAISPSIATTPKARSCSKFPASTTSSSTSLRSPAGVGSNDIGLDRGQIGDTRIVRWERRRSARSSWSQSNTGYRANTSDPLERRAVRDSFAESVLWGFDSIAEDDGRVLIDATEFFLRDSSRRVRTSSRSSVRAPITSSPPAAPSISPRTRNFPRNTEVEATITLIGGPAGEWLLLRHARSGDASPSASTTPSSSSRAPGYQTSRVRSSRRLFRRRVHGLRHARSPSPSSSASPSATAWRRRTRPPPSASP